MAPKARPPKLPLSLFASKPQPEQPKGSNRTIDAHLDLDQPSIKDLPPVLDGRTFGGSVGLSRVPGFKPPSGILLVKSLALHALPSTSLSFPTSSGPVELEITSSDLTEEVWEDINRVLDSVLGVAREVSFNEDVKMEIDGLASSSDRNTVTLSNLLPPPLPTQISPTMLVHQPFYQAYTRQISSLALIPGLCLKLLPPSILEEDNEEVGWWENEESLIKVLGAYLIPALDSFGSHRIMFGSSPTPLTLSTTHQAHRITPIPVVQNPRKDWHAVVLKVFRSIKLDPVSVGEIMGETASRVYMGTTGLDV